MDGSLILRTDEALYRIGGAAKPKAREKKKAGAVCCTSKLIPRIVESDERANFLGQTRLSILAEQ